MFSLRFQKNAILPDTIRNTYTLNSILETFWFYPSIARAPQDVRPKKIFSLRPGNSEAKERDFTPRRLGLPVPRFYFRPVWPSPETELECLKPCDRSASVWGPCHALFILALLYLTPSEIFKLYHKKRTYKNSNLWRTLWIEKKHLMPLPPLSLEEGGGRGWVVFVSCLPAR